MSFLVFSAGERRGLIVLSVLLLMVVGARALLPLLSPPALPPADAENCRAFAAFQERQQALSDSVEAVWAARRASWENRKGRVPRSNGKYKETATYIYAHTQGSPASEGFPPSASRAAATKASIARLPINTADTLDWKSLPGIGAKIARKIVSYRERLGGFVRCEQLLEVGWMDSARYTRLIPYLLADTDAVRKLPVNSASVAELKQHPYIDYYLAKSIVAHREKQGRYRSLEEVRTATHMYPELFDKLKPYLYVD
ncbi:MAG: helix-hairpin-helix domain-containing protein [Bacteroidales bacterium]|nr:helix-hairpin-helix domain-containing protein [Bacteroidales bacterium]